jgi:hypothetical protein
MPLTSVIFSLTRATGVDEEWIAKMFANLAAHGMTLGKPKPLPDGRFELADRVLAPCLF